MVFEQTSVLCQALRFGMSSTPRPCNESLWKLQTTPVPAPSQSPQPLSLWTSLAAAKRSPWLWGSAASAPAPPRPVPMPRLRHCTGPLPGEPLNRCPRLKSPWNPSQAWPGSWSIKPELIKGLGFHVTPDMPKENSLYLKMLGILNFLFFFLNWYRRCCRQEQYFYSHLKMMNVL